jgi:hypothetical protein
LVGLYLNNPWVIRAINPLNLGTSLTVLAMQTDKKIPTESGIFYLGFFYQCPTAAAASFDRKSLDIHLL